MCSWVRPPCIPLPQRALCAGAGSASARLLASPDPSRGPDVAETALDERHSLITFTPTRAGPYTLQAADAQPVTFDILSGKAVL